MSLADFQASKALRNESFASLIIAAHQRSHADDADRIDETWHRFFEFPDDYGFDHREAASMPEATASALLMAAYWKADSINMLGLAHNWPLLCAETEARNAAPGGRLDSDPAGVA